MAYQLNGNSLPLDAPFTVGTGKDAINYPANWLRLSTAEEKKAIGITEVSDPTTYDGRFYNSDGSAKSLVDVDATYEEDDPDGTYKKGDLIKNPDGTQHVYYGVKSTLIQTERGTVNSLLAEYDWYVTRKSEKGTAIPDTISTYRDGVRAAYETRKTEINNCADTAALINLYDSTYDSDGKFVKFNMTQYPTDPNRII
tara:strand:+ start:4622 stop:5215 length:594 start_codon:yes stop_codon:yes gene_type:complete